MTKTLIAAVLLTNITLSSLFAEEPPQKADLPTVLIIGDSISLGYTPYVTKILKGQAIVTHHKGNAGPTIRAVEKIDEWLGSTKWDVIHFNWGLWDIYGWEYAKDDRSPAMYEKRLEQLLVRLEKTGAKLIWGTTTPSCPAPEKTMLVRFKTKVMITPAVEKEYLDAALRVMNNHSIQINDLHAFITPKLKKYALADDNVHYTEEGREQLGKQVAESIAQNLKSKKKAAPDKK